MLLFCHRGTILVHPRVLLQKSCTDVGISDLSDRYINQPGKGPSFHTNEFMDGYNDGFYVCSSGTNNPDSDYPDYFLDENLSSSDISRDGDVTLGVECQMCLLNDDQLFQQLSEHQCFTSIAVLNLGGSILGCYESARNINCDIENGKRYYCPGVATHLDHCNINKEIRNRFMKYFRLRF
ncbi:MAG: hypothetical protein WBL68_17725, partial [Nitrososphaeraceae archaeon]